jgi:phospho-N-acetylmuramoyl-pentapeptide-transferase
LDGIDELVAALLLAATVSMIISIVGTRFLIDWLRARRLGQPIREDGPKGHITKAGTPTMGGLAIVVGACAGYLVAHARPGLVFTRSGLLCMAAIVGAGVVGLLDDWIKVSRERNLGLNKRAKIIGLLVVAGGFSVLALIHTPVETRVSFTRFDSFEGAFHLGDGWWLVWAVLLILAFSNAVNLTDGLDGLAAGSAIFAFSAFVVIGFWGFRHPEVYRLEHALDVAVVAAAMLGGIVGFLWWNAAPARIIMGDTGSLAIGTGLAVLSLTLSTHLLLPIVGGLYVLETISVVLQVGSFRLLKRRVFRMAPIHHHFELAGWPETTVIIRFWILSGLCTALALGIYYADFINTGALD